MEGEEKGGKTTYELLRCSDWGQDLTDPGKGKTDLLFYRTGLLVSIIL